MSHVEITREIARRFNHLYGREPDFEDKAEAAVKKLGARTRASVYERAAQRVPGEGRRGGAGAGARAARRSAEPRRSATASGCSATSRARGSAILPEPQALLTETPKLPGLDGAEDVASPTATRSCCARSRPRSRRRSARCRPTRRACGAPIRAIPRNARCGSCTRSTRTSDTQTWVRQGLHARPASAASTASSR